MGKRFGASITIDRPVTEVFDFLANGENDAKWSARVQEMEKKTDGPPGLGTVYASRVKDAGLKSAREFEYTVFDAPSRIRWAERSKNSVMAVEGGYDLTPEGPGTRVDFFNVLEGHGIGKLLVGFAAKAANKDAPKMVAAMKRAIESG